MQDYYEKLAFDYDEFGAIDNYLGNERDFFERLFRENGIATVLDCACGTGQHLLMLKSLGLAVKGSDYSESMLEVADKNLRSRGLEVDLRQCDFRFLERAFNETFDAIVCLTNSLPHLTTDEDLITALRSMRGRMRDGGLLVLTSGTTHYSLTKTPMIETVVNREDFSRVFVKETKGDFLTIHILDLFHSPKRNESNQYEMHYRILLDEDYRQLLDKAGFSAVNVYGDYAMHEYVAGQSRRLIVVARK